MDKRHNSIRVDALNIRQNEAIRQLNFLESAISDEENLVEVLQWPRPLPLVSFEEVSSFRLESPE